MSPRSAIAPHQPGLAFDSLAEHYDDIFTCSLIGRAQRDAVWNVVTQTFRRGDSILEVNCGTGEDALFLARMGVSVFACDASEQMIAVARHRCVAEGSPLPVHFEVLPTEQIGEARPLGPFDGVFSDFSGLNCVADIVEVARQLSALVKPGAPALLCLSTRICLWETVWFLTRGEFKSAFRRWQGHATARLGGFVVEVQYPTVRTLRKLFSPFFCLHGWTGIGVAVPPSYLEHLARRYPSVLHRLCAIDKTICTWPLFRGIGDHVLLFFERTAS
jgi:2-polyprenyl-3-methyl-5-hydroxy-6-metoxy-1,4-benzoquinol methylase